MDIVGGFDVHRKQITFDYIEMDSGEIHCGNARGSEVVVGGGGRFGSHDRDRQHVFLRFAQQAVGPDRGKALGAVPSDRRRSRHGPGGAGASRAREPIEGSIGA